MQRLGVLLLGTLVACGGSSAKPPTNYAERPPDARPATRQIIEHNDEDENTDIQLTSSHGKMDPADIEKAMASHTTAISECYTEQVGTRKWLGGEVLLHWWIDANGKLTSVALGDGNLST